MKKGLSLVIALFLAGMLSSVFLSGCAEKQETIKIVTSFNMRGVSAGEDTVNGVKLALEEVDYKVGNFDIELVIEDDGDENGVWLGDLEKGIAERAVADKDVMVYIGSAGSGAAKSSIPILNKAGLVQISPHNTWPGLTQSGFLPGEPGIFYPTGKRNYFRVIPTDAIHGPAGAIWAQELGAKNVYIFNSGDAYGIGIANLFEKKAREIGLNVLGHETLILKKADYDAELKALIPLEIDLVYFGGLAPDGSVPLVKSVKKILGVKFMGADGIVDSAFIVGGGAATEATYATTAALPPSELKGTKFYSDYLKEYGKEPAGYSALGYETAKIALMAIERAGVKDRNAILNEVANVRNYDGLFGTWSFDENGDTTLRVVSGNKVIGGEFVFLKLIQEDS